MPRLPDFPALWRPDGSQVYRFFRGRRQERSAGSEAGWVWNARKTPAWMRLGIGILGLRRSGVWERRGGSVLPRVSTAAGGKFAGDR